MRKSIFVGMCCRSTRLSETVDFVALSFGSDHHATEEVDLADEHRVELGRIEADAVKDAALIRTCLESVEQTIHDSVDDPKPFVFGGLS